MQHALYCIRAWKAPDRRVWQTWAFAPFLAARPELLELDSLPLSEESLLEVAPRAGVASVGDANSASSDVGAMRAEDVSPFWASVDAVGAEDV